MTTGIYAIVHIASGRRYIGASTSVYRRWQQHRIDLSDGSHHCPKLRAIWKGDPRSASFEFVLLSECHSDDLERLEQQEIDKAMVEGLCLNAVTSPLVKQIMVERGRQKKEQLAARWRTLCAQEAGYADEDEQMMYETVAKEEEEEWHNDLYDTLNMTAEDVLRWRGW